MGFCRCQIIIYSTIASEHKSFHFERNGTKESTRFRYRDENERRRHHTPKYQRIPSNNSQKNTNRLQKSTESPKDKTTKIYDSCGICYVYKYYGRCEYLILHERKTNRNL